MDILPDIFWKDHHNVFGEFSGKFWGYLGQQQRQQLQNSKNLREDSRWPFVSRSQSNLRIPSAIKMADCVFVRNLKVLEYSMET